MTLTYIKEHSPTNTCTGCVGDTDSLLCDKLSKSCSYSIFKLPKDTYRGFNVNIAVEFIKGHYIEYSRDNGTTWSDVAVYENKPNDIHRISNNNYLFRVRPNEVVRYMYLNTAMGSDEGHEDNNAIVTFVNNKPTKIELV